MEVIVISRLHNIWQYTKEYAKFTNTLMRNKKHKEGEKSWIMNTRMN